MAARTVLDEAFEDFCNTQLGGVAHHMHVTRKAFEAGMNLSRSQLIATLGAVYTDLETLNKHIDIFVARMKTDNE